ncbi:MAG: Glutathione S-transferase, N-terminal domain [Novosphingobium sp.]|nr:Glutathione S-transferase, N-terminal domain [Novosphingobium sp.]
MIASGNVCDIREVKLSAKPAELLAASPKATVPVLVLPNGTVIDESLDVMRWALQGNDPDHWLGHDDAALIAANDGPFKAHLDRYKYPDRYVSDPAEQREAGVGILLVLEAMLTTHPYLGGAAMGLTDAAILPFVRQFAATDRPWFDAQPLPGIQAWLARFLVSPLFAAAMLRLPPWQPGDEAVLFP